MRICVLANALAVHTQRWTRAYAERDHEVHLLSIRHAEIPGVRVHTVCVGPVNAGSRVWTLLSYVRLLFAAGKRIRRLTPDVLHAHYTVTHGVIAAFSGFRPGVVSAWGSDVIWGGKGRMPWPLRLLNRYALGGADLVCATSRFMAERMTPYLRSGGGALQVPFGVDAHAFAPAREEAGRDSLRIGFVKTLLPKYGPETLIHAMALVAAELPQARLILAGRGRLRAELEDLARRLGLADRVEFVGFVPHDQVPDLMRSLDVFVNCSVVPESFGVSILEASASGVPVVATRVGGVPEVCRDGETGLLVDPGSSEALAGAILRLAGDEGLRARMGEAGRRFVLARYVWRDNVDEMLLRLERLAGRRADGKPRPSAVPDRELSRGTLSGA